MYNITDGEGRIMLNHDQIVISRSSWRVNDQAAKLNGLITLGKDEEYLNLNVVADKVDLEAITDVGVSGIVGGRAHIGGTTVAPRVDATIGSDGISYNGYHVDRLQVNVVYDNGLVRIDDAHLSLAMVMLKVKVNTSLIQVILTLVANDSYLIVGYFHTRFDDACYGNYRW